MAIPVDTYVPVPVKQPSSDARELCRLLIAAAIFEKRIVVLASEMTGDDVLTVAGRIDAAVWHGVRLVRWAHDDGGPDPDEIDRPDLFLLLRELVHENHRPVLGPYLRQLRRDFAQLAPVWFENHDRALYGAATIVRSAAFTAYRVNVFSCVLTAASDAFDRKIRQRLDDERAARNCADAIRRPS